MATVKKKMDVIVSAKGTETTKKKIGGVEKSIGSMAKGALVSVASFYALKKAMDFTVVAKNAARDAIEIRSKFDAVFRDMTGKANKMADSLAASFGLAGTTARELLGDTADLLTGFGFAQEEALNFSIRTNQLAIDLASFTNYAGGAEGATSALVRAFTGEREALKSLGIVVSEEMVKIELLRLGKENLTGQALMQAKAEATLNIAYAQSVNAIGDYARTQNDLANVERRRQETQKELIEQIGDALVPAFTKANIAAMSLFNSITKFVEKMKPKDLSDYAEKMRELGASTMTVAWANLLVLQTDLIKKQREAYEQTSAYIGTEEQAAIVVEYTRKNRLLAYEQLIKAQRELEINGKYLNKEDKRRYEEQVSRQSQVIEKYNEMSQAAKTFLDGIAQLKVVGPDLDNVRKQLEAIRKGIWMPSKKETIQSVIIDQNKELIDQNAEIIKQTETWLDLHTRFFERVKEINEERIKWKEAFNLIDTIKDTTKLIDVTSDLGDTYRAGQKYASQFTGFVSSAILQMAGSNKNAFAQVEEAFKNMLTRMAAEFLAKSVIFGLASLLPGGFGVGLIGGKAFSKFVFGAQYGADFVTQKPTLILAGEHGVPEHVKIQPAPIMNDNSGGNLTINMYGTYYQDVDHLAQEIADRSNLGFNRIAINA